MVQSFFEGKNWCFIIRTVLRGFKTASWTYLLSNKCLPHERKHSHVAAITFPCLCFKERCALQHAVFHRQTQCLLCLKGFRPKAVYKWHLNSLKEIWHPSKHRWPISGPLSPSPHSIPPLTMKQQGVHSSSWLTRWIGPWPPLPQGHSESVECLEFVGHPLRRPSSFNPQTGWYAYRLSTVLIPPGTYIMMMMMIMNFAHFTVKL